jgi:hypothetical protein
VITLLMSLRDMTGTSEMKTVEKALATAM